MSQSDPGKAIWDGLITDLTPLSLSNFAAYWGWDKDLRPHPRYPVDPVADCPLWLFRDYTATHQAMTGGTTRYDLRGSIWVYLKQTPGQAHQELMETLLKALSDFFLGNFNPTAMRAAGSEFVIPLERVVHDLLEHPLGEPKLRVTCGELALGVKAKTTN